MARGLREVTMAHEAGELIEVHWVPFSEACLRALNGDISDGKTALGLLRAQALLASKLKTDNGNS